jgi:aminoglycoside/choline kinase family phosphotransferase
MQIFKNSDEAGLTTQTDASATHTVDQSFWWLPPYDTKLYEREFTLLDFYVMSGFGC